MKADNPWRWKVSDPAMTDRTGLLYEPGNWGDLFKGVWIERILEAFPAGGSHLLVDPFAGRPVYPLVPDTARRLEFAFPAGPPGALEPLLREGELPSSARWLMAAGAARNQEWQAEVFDLAPAAREAWQSVPGVRLLDLRDGAEALSVPVCRRASLVLFDPYDLFDRWSSWLGDLLEIARETPLVLYIYNKAPRGAGHFRKHRDLRKALHRGVEAHEGRTGMILGRCPADATLPRAFHDLVLLGPREFVEPLGPGLETVTREFSLHLLGEGLAETCFPDGDIPGVDITESAG